MRAWIGGHPVWSLLAVLLVAFGSIVILKGVFAPDSTEPAVPPKAVGKKEVPVFPELHIAAAGRLPTRLHGFRLGMTVAEALLADSRLKNLDHNKGEVDPSEPNAVLETAASEGFFDTLWFRHGRMIQIVSAPGNLGPEDADQVQQNTLNQLGEPNIRHYVGPEKESLVWIDGDVGIDFYRYRGIMELTLAAFPELIADIQDKPENEILPKAKRLEEQERFWGMIPDEPPTLKAVPSGISGMELGTQPWQVRTLVPGMDIFSLSDGRRASGKYAREDYEVSVAFWNGSAYSICITQRGVSIADFERLRSQLIDQYGTPVSDNQIRKSVFLEWDDGSRNLWYALEPETGQNATGERGSETTCLSDKRVFQVVHAATDGPPSFAPAPPSHSFF
jgi:hypothetical protein